MKRTDQTSSKREFNPWKWAFTILLVAVLSYAVFITLKVTVPSTQQENETQVVKVASKDYSKVNVTMNEQNFSAAINYLLRNVEKGSGIKYRFILNKSAVLMGTTSVLGKKITFSVYAKPSLDSNGNIKLKIKSVGVGSLNAPPAFVLSYIKKNYDLKGIVAINSAQKVITLRLDKLTAKDGLRIKANKMNLDNNQIDFSVLIPNK